MLIDWLTLSIGGELLNEQDRQKLDSFNDRIIKLGKDGDILGDYPCWSRIGSDCTAISFRFGTRLTFSGSPAALTRRNNVFGSDDIRHCFRSFIVAFAKAADIHLPFDIKKYTCSRIDVTQNYDMGGQTAVMQALNYLESANTRNTVHGSNVSRMRSTIYWNRGSSYRSAKAYNKFLQAKNQNRKRLAQYTNEQLELTKRIIRLELQLGRHFLARYSKPWYELTPDDLQTLHSDFFKDAIGSAEVPTMDTLFFKLIDVAPTEGQARAAMNMFYLIESLGIETVRRQTTESTFYRNRNLLIKAGLSKADLNAGRILEFRHRSLILGDAVSTWDELKRASNF